MRSILTTLGIVIGIFAVTIMSTAITGLRNAFIKSIASIGSDVFFVEKWSWFSDEDWHVMRNRKYITWEQYEKLRTALDKDVDAVVPSLSGHGAQVKNRDKSTEASMIIGTTADYVKTTGTFPAYGRFMTDFEVKASHNICVVGQDIVDNLFPNEDPINKYIKVNGNTLRIVGVLEKQGSGFMGSMSLDGQIIMPLELFKKIIGPRRDSFRINIKVKDVKEMAVIKEEIRDIMRSIRKVPYGKPDDFGINQQEALTKMYDSIVGVVAIAGLVITALSLFVGAIGIMNIMFVSVKERTKEIGIRKAIGAKTWSILLQFLAEAAIICMIGGAIGVIIAYPVSLIINQFFPTSMPIGIVVIAFLISAVVGVISGFLPAFKASKMDPVEALRYE
ncbi:MAG: ABC transporter permease [Bacteroidota bacterium]|nr:ABC transporter permease [Bacteroidota bacterium]MDP4193964.1 ABC transporter permease [Bacteroidota bacterium]